MTEKEQTQENAAHAWMQIESQLNYILEHLRDAKEVGNLEDRAEEIKRHAMRAKDMFDWLDNFCAVSFN